MVFFMMYVMFFFVMGVTNFRIIVFAFDLIKLN